MSRSLRPTREQLRAAMTHSANSARDTADCMAGMFDGCDDPLHPWKVLTPEFPYADWLDFTERVCRPIVESEDDPAALQVAMREYRKANPHYIAVALVMAANRVAKLGRGGTDA